MGVLGVLLWVLSVSCASAQIITETKGLQVRHVDGWLATTVVNVKFQAQLPNMDLKVSPTNDTCVKYEGRRSLVICEARKKIDVSTYELLTELNGVFQADVQLRNKRALMGFLGTIRKYVEGTATEDDLNVVMEAANKLGKQNSQ